MGRGREVNTTTHVDPASRTGRKLRRLAMQQKVQLRKNYRGHLNGQRTIIKWYIAEKRNQAWVVTQDIGGVPVRYFRFDYNKVWTWTRSPKRAAVFTSLKGAERVVSTTTMPYSSQYSVRRRLTN